MAIKIRCDECGELFIPADDGLRLIRKLAEDNAPFAMVTCTKCFKSTGCNPVAALGGEADKSIENEGQAEQTYRCPTPQCIGWVCEVEYQDEGQDQDQDEDQEESTFWGCGKCGKVWRKKSALYKAISKSVKRFPHRKNSYLRTGEGWEPGLEDDEHPDYEELVDGEPSK